MKVSQIIVTVFLLANAACAENEFGSAEASSTKTAATANASGEISVNGASNSSSEPEPSNTSHNPGQPAEPAAQSCPTNPNRPNMAQFLAATGTDNSTASDLLYGVIGSNGDSRNWSAILSSGNPVAAARSATNAMYNGPYCRSSAAVRAPGIIAGCKVSTVAKITNFEFLRNECPGMAVYHYLMLVDGEGYFLTSQHSRAVNFGFDTSVLPALRTQVSQLGLIPNF